MSLPRELFFKKECLGEGQASRVDALKAVTLLKRCLPKEFFLKKYAWAKPRHCLGEAQGSRVEAFKSVTLFKCCLPKEFCFKKYAWAKPRHPGLRLENQLPYSNVVFPLGSS